MAATPAASGSSSAAQVTPANVRALKVAWSFSTGDLASHARSVKRAAFEDTPIMAGGRLYVESPFNEVFALDPGSGQPLWRFNPALDARVRYGEGFTARGVAYWRDPAAASGAPCAERIFLATNDRRLIALDAATGKPCAGFGQGGSVDVAAAVRLNEPREMQMTSPPVVARGVVVVGSSVADNQRLKEVSGAVRAFVALSGAPRWCFAPLACANPPLVSGAANVCRRRCRPTRREGLVFLPTTSPSP